MINKLLFIVLILSSCENEKTKLFDFHFNQKTIIINKEQDNRIEGTYLIVKKIKNKKINLNLPKKFYISNKNKEKWLIGWGNNQPYYDAGCENIREIKFIYKNTIILGKLLRGKGFPHKNQKIVFWSRLSNNFKKFNNKSIIDLKQWKEFAGKSNSFGGIDFDKKLKKWIILFQECDTIKRQIYAGESINLINWKPSFNGKPILKYTHFKNISWAENNFKLKQTPVISDLFYSKKKWYIILNGTDKKGYKNVGIAYSHNSILGPYKILKNPILKAGNSNEWNNKGCFSAKVSCNKNKYVIAFDGINKEGEENVGIAFSYNLKNWEMQKNNPIIKIHKGWRSKKESSETDYIEWKNDSIILLISGTKNFKTGLLSKYIFKDRFKSIPGNVDDAQLGVYISTNNGLSFYAHKNNPVIINDYSNISENEHMGGNVKFIKTDSLLYFFYQAKTSENCLKYSIYLRTKK